MPVRFTVKSARWCYACVSILIASLMPGGCAPAGPAEYEYTVAAITRGDIESVVSTTGSVAPLNTVVVGSEVSGKVSALYADFNDPVESGQLIARIDPRTLEERITQAQAAVAVAEAGKLQRAAELDRAVAERERAERELTRLRRLEADGHLSGSELDAEETALAIAIAQEKIANAAIANAEAAYSQQLAMLKLARLDLERTEIRSPVSGVVIKRNVEVGQTVAASLQAPELFQIAQDLAQMKVEANIDEVDIGRIGPGMPCRFTVDAYPHKQFRGRVEQVRKAPEILHNVVTYKVIISTTNEDLHLLPGMTAHVAIISGRRENVLKVPNAALRFVPPPGTGWIGDPVLAPATVWQRASGKLQPAAVEVGLVNERETEVLSGVREGDSVVVRALPLER
jgi:HlyD family secretion protein